MVASKQLHPNNRHQGKKGGTYDFAHLTKVNPDLKQFVQVSPRGNDTINFSDDKAVKALNKSLLMAFYNVQFWDLPPQFLCPPVPGRADYIHYLADLLQESTVFSNKVKGLDIGTGANLIYPIVGAAEYDWDFVGSDIDATSVKLAKQIVDFNSVLKNKVKIRRQANPNHIFDGVIKSGDKFTFSMCNPPFHESAEAAAKGTARKNQNLKQKSAGLNFGGRHNELWCDGGELQFIKNMISESQQFASSVLWFTTLVSKKDNLKPIYQALKSVKPEKVKTIEMAQGNKLSRFVAWTFVPIVEHKNW